MAMLLVLAATVRSIIRRRAGFPQMQARMSRLGLAQRKNFGPVTLTPWHPRMRIDLKPLRGGLYRLQIRYTGFVPNFHPSSIVHIDVKLDPSGSVVLRHRLETWLRAASSQAPATMASGPPPGDSHN